MDPHTEETLRLYRNALLEISEFLPGLYCDPAALAEGALKRFRTLLQEAQRAEDADNRYTLAVKDATEAKARVAKLETRVTELEELESTAKRLLDVSYSGVCLVNALENTVGQLRHSATERKRQLAEAKSDLAIVTSEAVRVRDGLRVALKRIIADTMMQQVEDLAAFSWEREPEDRIDKETK